MYKSLPLIIGIVSQFLVIFFKYILAWLVKIELFSSLTDKYFSLIFKTFVLDFVKGGIMILVINISIEHSSIFSNLIFLGVFDTLNMTWF